MICRVCYAKDKTLYMQQPVQIASIKTVHINGFWRKF